MRALIALSVAAVLQAPEPDPHPNRLRHVPNPRAQHGGWVADPARHLRTATVDSINALVDALERETSVEMAVVVLDSLDNLAVDQAALTLHRRWGVGKRAHDNGIVLLWSPARREISVSVGYGLEGSIPDARAGRIQDREMIPRFRNGAFDAGVLAGVRALADAAREDPRSHTRPGARGATPIERAARVGSTHDGEGSRGAAVIGGGALLLGLGGVGAWWLRRRRYRPRPCPHGHGMMRLIGNEVDDRYLSREEALEERIGSIDYDVWICDVCSAQTRVPHSKWFSRYSSCPKCRRRTLREEQDTLRAATTVSEGLVEIRRECRNCGYRHVERRTTPRRTPSDSSTSGRSGASSSRGGGSSFGGGSAGGGGASRRY